MTPDAPRPADPLTEWIAEWTRQTEHGGLAYISGQQLDVLRATLDAARTPRSDVDVEGLIRAAYDAYGLIASVAGGDWSTQTDEWRQAAAEWEAQTAEWRKGWVPR